MTDLPFDPRQTTYLTNDVEGIGGLVKESPEAFIVEELPAYEPSGEGEHIYLWVEKRDVSAKKLVHDVAQRFGVRTRDIGVAGMKDRRAITRQWLSVHSHDIDPDDVVGPIGDDIEILQAKRHGNKLKTGHLYGNRFEVRLDGLMSVNDDAKARVAAVLERLQEVGVPNYYGSQRFGNDLETLRLGLRRVRGEHPSELKGKRWLERLAVSAAQSAMFNWVLDERIRAGTEQTAQLGDRLNRVGTRGQLFVTPETMDEAVAGMAAGELVPTGPMFGPKMYDVADRVAETEARALELFGLTPADFVRVKKIAPGTRRDLFVHFVEPVRVLEWGEEHLKLGFSLPSGAYATIVLAEIAKFDFSAWEAT